MTDENQTKEAVNAPKTEESGFGAVVRNKLSGIWHSRAMTPARVTYNTAYWLTSPVWYPSKLALKAGVWGLGKENKTAKIGVPTGAALALTAYFGVASYGFGHAVVAAGDYYWFGQPYSSGERTGRISRLSQVGKWPCSTWEGELALPNIASGGSSTFQFSIRNLAGMNNDIIRQLQEAYNNQSTVSLSYRQSHWPKEWFNSEAEGWFFPHINNYGCYQKTDYNINGAQVRMGVDWGTGAPPRLQLAPQQPR